MQDDVTPKKVTSENIKIKPPQLQIKTDEGCFRFKCQKCSTHYYIFTKEMWKLFNHKVPFRYALESIPKSRRLINKLSS